MKLLSALLVLSWGLALGEPPPSGVDAATLIANSKSFLDADDFQAALSNADAAVAAGGGAAALAARAEAKLALGRPAGEAIEDYAAAARLDPQYAEKYEGLIAQTRSEARRDRSAKNDQSGAGGVSMRFVGGLAATGVLLVAISILVFRRNKGSAKSSTDF